MALSVVIAVITSVCSVQEVFVPPDKDCPQIGVKMTTYRLAGFTGDRDLPKNGIVVEEVFFGSPAMSAGLKPYDVIYSAGGKIIDSLDTFDEWLLTIQSEKRYRLGVSRKLDNGKRITKRIFVTPSPRTWKLPKPDPPSQEKPNPTGWFNGFSWGTSREAISKRLDIYDWVEGGAQRMIYRMKLADLDIFAVYFFANNNLVRGRYVSATSHLDPALYLQDYGKLRELLTEKYGQPITGADDSVWLAQKPQRYDRSQSAQALAAGQLQKLAIWIDGDMAVSLSMFRYDGKIVLYIQYENSDLSAAEELERKMRALGKL